MTLEELKAEANAHGYNLIPQKNNEIDRPIIPSGEVRFIGCHFGQGGGDNIKTAKAMTREEAIQILRTRVVPTRNWQEIHEAVDMAIEALHREEAEEKGWCHRIIPKNVEVVVRCMDCIHYESDGGALMVCRIDDMVVDDTDYCSYGERKGGDEE